MSAKAGRDDVEKALWRWSGWKADQRGVDTILEVVDQYVRGQVERAGGNPNPMVGAQRAAEKLLTDAREEASRIIEQAQQQATVQIPAQKGSVLPADGLKCAPWVSSSITPYQAPDGMLWLRISAAPVDKPVQNDGTRKCTKCMKTKPIARFNRDNKGKAGRKAHCMDCENAARREREFNKRQQREANTPGVR